MSILSRNTFYSKRIIKVDEKYEEYCNKNPVHRNYWNEMKNPNSHVGKYIDQYESLQAFVDDVWIRYKPYGGRCFYERQGLYEIKGTQSLIYKLEGSKFYNQAVENRYLAHDRYKELKQHY